MRIKFILICLLLAFMGLCFFITNLPAAADSGPEAYTPQPGSAERKAILDALRTWVYQQHHLDVVFVVKYLRVKNGYAWVHTLPQSRDGSNRYEDISTLLKKD